MEEKFKGQEFRSLNKVFDVLENGEDLHVEQIKRNTKLQKDNFFYNFTEGYRQLTKEENGDCYRSRLMYEF